MPRVCGKDAAAPQGARPERKGLTGRWAGETRAGPSPEHPRTWASLKV